MFAIVRLDFSAENSAISAALNHVNIAQSYSSLIQVVYDMMLEKQALVVRHADYALHWLLASSMYGQTSSTRQSEMANTSPSHIPVLGNIPPLK